jgi:hypothetical protein
LRATDPERFRPLHGAVLDLVAELGRLYDADVDEGVSELDRHFGLVGLDRPSLRIAPRRTDAAPLIVAFTSFPGIAVGFGLGSSEIFPNCGCDACGESLEGEMSRLRSLVEDVTAGRFLEVFKAGDPSVCRWERWSDSARSAGTAAVPRGVDPGLRRWQQKTIQWRPWQRREEPKERFAGARKPRA